MHFQRKYNKKTKDIPLTSFYTGLGELLCYFQHGVEQGYLALGAYGVPGDRIELLNRLEEKIGTV